MRRSIRVSADAEEQIRKAARWWRENRPAAPDLFRLQLQRGFDLIASETGLGQRTESSVAKGVRRLHLSRIHCFLYYRIVDSDIVEVLALWHTSRGGQPENL